MQKAESERTRLEFPGQNEENRLFKVVAQSFTILFYYNGNIYQCSEKLLE